MLSSQMLPHEYAPQGPAAVRLTFAHFGDIAPNVMPRRFIDAAQKSAQEVVSADWTVQGSNEAAVLLWMVYQVHID